MKLKGNFVNLLKKNLFLNSNVLNWYPISNLYILSYV